MRYLSLVFIIIIIAFSAFVIPSAALQVDNGAIPSAALEYMEGVVLKLPAGQHYFLFRSGDFTTDLVTSEDLYLEDNVIYGTDVTLYRYNSRGSQEGNYNYVPEFTTINYDSLQLDTNTYSIAYSSLGDWSELVSRDQSDGNTWLKYILWTVVIAFLVFLAFKFFRNRRSYINL